MGLAQAEEEPAELAACAIARDITSFDLLIEDLDAELGEAWGGLNFDDAALYLASPEAQQLEFVAIAVDRQDEDDLEPIIRLIELARNAGIASILVAHDLTPVALHRLLRAGADDFAPYPLPEGALKEAVERIRQARTAPSVPCPQAPGGGAAREGAIIPVFGLGGGVGATTFTVNLAWELAQLGAGDGLKVCVLDFELQFGSVSTYLDLPRREAIFELLSDTEAMDDEAFRQALLPFGDKLQVLTAPADALPLEILDTDDVNRLLDRAQSMFDFVLIDMPTTLISWTETVLNRAAIFFAVMEMDMRCAQNALRFIRLLKAEDLPFEKVRYVLNRAPKFTDLTGRSRVKRLAENLDIKLELLFPDGGRPVTEANDAGLPLSEAAPKNPLRKEILKLATSIHDLATVEAETG